MNTYLSDRRKGTLDMTTALVLSEDRPSLELAIAAWLNAKTQRSNSRETTAKYTAYIAQFRQALRAVGMDLDGDMRKVALVAQAWASSSVDGKPVAPATFNQRLAILSSFYAYGKRHLLLDGENPISLVERRPVQAYAHAVGMASDAVRDALARIDRTTLQGTRDYALLLLAVSTGRRANELASMVWGDVTLTGSHTVVTFPRTKGGKVMSDRLEPAVAKALLTYVQAVYGDNLSEIATDAPLWLSLSRSSKGHPLTRQALSLIWERHLGTSKVHATRHTFALNMEKAGATVSEIQSRLGHSNLATTGRYLTKLTSDENRHGGKLMKMYGVE